MAPVCSGAKPGACAPTAPTMIVATSAPASTHEPTKRVELFNDPTLFLRSLVRSHVLRVPVMQMAALTCLVDRGDRVEKALRVLRLGRFHPRGGRLPQALGPLYKIGVLTIQQPLHFLGLILDCRVATSCARLGRPASRHAEKLRRVDQHLEVMTLRRPLLRGPRCLMSDAVLVRNVG